MFNEHDQGLPKAEILPLLRLHSFLSTITQNSTLDIYVNI